MELSIILRVCNRLEYTIQSIESILTNTVGDYELIVYNNNSNDGTKERLNWMKKNVGNGLRDNVVVYNSEKNQGDWGGMIEGSKLAKGEFICQYDNDILVGPKWNRYGIEILKNSGYLIVMFKRQWERYELVESTHEEIVVEGETIKYGDIQKPVGCYILRTGNFKQYCEDIPATASWQSKVLLAKMTGGRVCKILNKPCKLIDGWDSPVYQEFCDKRVETLRPLVGCKNWDKYPREKNGFFV